MKQSNLTCLSVLSLLLVSIQCHAELDDRFFTGSLGFAGVNGFQLNSNPTYTEDEAVSQQNLEMRAEFRGGGAIDVALAYTYSPVVFQGEVGYLALDSDQLLLTSNGRAIDFRSTSDPDKAVGVFSGIYGAANLYYPIKVPSVNFVPYVGVGAGLLHYQFETGNVNFGAEASPSKKSSGMLRAILGVDYRFSENSPYHWGVRYRYQSISNVKLDLVSEERGVTKKIEAEETIHLSDFSLVFGYRLDSRIK